MYFILHRYCIIRHRKNQLKYINLHWTTLATRMRATTVTELLFWRSEDELGPPGL